MLTLRNGSGAGLIAQAALLGVLAATVGLSVIGWAVGLTCGVVTHATVVRGLLRRGARALGPADLVTLIRATFACGAAALVADSFLGQPAVTALVALAVTALVLDAVDGWIARRTCTVSMFGARFDGEVDAFLILVLSVYVAGPFSGWVLAIGAARYVFGVAGWVLPWLRGQLPPRYWRKVVAAVQGIVLTFAAADLLPRPVMYAALVVALALLTESFGRDVWWLWRHRTARPADIATRGRRPIVATAANVSAVLLVWCALLAPNQAYLVSPSAFFRIPLEGLVVAGLALVLPPVGRRTLAVAAGVLLALLTIAKMLDMGFFAAFDRPFNVVTDRGYFGPAVSLLSDSIGPTGAMATVAGAILLVLAMLVCMPLSVGRCARLVARHRTGSARVVAGLTVVWVVCAASGAQIGRGVPIASATSGSLAIGQVRAISAGVGDEQRFEEAAAVDRFRDSDEGRMLAGLRGKDVLLVFVESYGRVAIEALPSSSRVQAVLDAGTVRLAASGYSARSAYLTSPTFGGLSWLAHGTLQSGLWVSNQRRYDRLLSSDRMTLSRAFGRAGWRSVAFMPSTDEPWPEGESFYRFDRSYDRTDIEYAGPKFGFSLVPDQYALRYFFRRELARQDRSPVMAEIDLTSSHPPWAPLPRMVEWDRLGDGSVFHSIKRSGDRAGELWPDPDRVRPAYVQSIVYSLNALISFVQKYGDDDLVLILLGDHQPAAVVSGHEASHDVPVTIIAHDPAVLDRIAGWGWHDGMRPGSDAPVWPMDAFRDRFLAAYGGPPTADTPRPVAQPQP